MIALYVPGKIFPKSVKRGELITAIFGLIFLFHIFIHLSPAVASAIPHTVCKPIIKHINKPLPGNHSGYIFHTQHNGNCFKCTSVAGAPMAVLRCYVPIIVKQRYIQ